MHTLTVDESYVVMDPWASERVGDLENVLGVGFNPAELWGFSNISQLDIDCNRKYSEIGPCTSNAF